MITAREGRLDFELALPDSVSVVPSGLNASHLPSTSRTAEEMEALERNNLILALEAAHWRVAGENRAAQRLRMNPSTLTSRMKALGIQRPK